MASIPCSFQIPSARSGDLLPVITSGCVANALDERGYNVSRRTTDESASNGIAQTAYVSLENGSVNFISVSELLPQNRTQQVIMNRLR